jgi:hypothetical protein
MMMVVFMALPEPLARLDVQQGHDEKDESEDNHQKVKHRDIPSPGCGADLTATSRQHTLPLRSST